MFKNFFVAAIRNLRKNRLYSAINVLGLALGVACCMIIFVIVRFETSFDDYHGKAGRIYRVNLNQQTPQGLWLDGCNYAPVTEAIRNEVTGLEAVTGVRCLQVYQFSKEDNLFEGKFAFFADQQYFDVFDVQWLAGNQPQALTSPNTVVVTDTFAEEFLGGVKSALGSIIRLENKLDLTVTGIVSTPPKNTDHPYSILISYPSLARFSPASVDNWETISSDATYVVFNEKTQSAQLYPQLNKIISKNLKEDIAKNTQFFLMPLNDNHDRNFDYSSFTYDFPVPVMVILSVIAGMIAFIACINFVNLATAQSLKRAREVGIRKTLGSSRPQLIMQYMSEAFVITLLAVAVGMLLAKLGMAQLNELYGGNYLRFDLLGEPETLLFIAGITILISFLAGFYPAFILSGYRPVAALKAHHSNTNPRGFSLRRGLVVLQFAGAQMLILVTIILINQINHFKERPVGFDPETVIILPHLRGNDAQQYDKLALELRQVPGILNFSFGFAGENRVDFFNKEGEENKHNGLLYYGDSLYIRTFNMELLWGKNFPPGLIHASNEVLVNEALIKSLGIENPAAAIGTFYNLNGEEVAIRGVMKDFYTQSMSDKIDPVTLQYNPAKIAGVVMNISTEHLPATLAGIEKAWKNVYPDFLCKYHFMDDSLEREYGFFNVIFTFLGTASFLAIFIGCLGLYGLVSFMAVQRTKEIGIRKVFGATVSNIMMMFSKESIILIVIAFVVAAPLAHLFGIAMVMELPQRVDPGLGIFPITLLASLVVALLTVSYRSFSAAVQNPIDSLRNE